jgi:hypothetical protein
MIELEHVDKFFGDFQALSDINVKVGSGGRGGDRAVRVGQVDDDPLHQPARGARCRPHRGRRHRTVERHPQHPGDPPRDRDGVPELQPVPAPERARQRHAGSAQGPQAPKAIADEMGMALLEQVKIPEQAPSTPGQLSAGSSSVWPSHVHWR